MDDPLAEGVGIMPFRALVQGDWAAYRLDRDDGHWSTHRIEVLGQREDGGSVLLAFSKTAVGEVAEWISAEEAPGSELPWFTPMKQEVVRRVRGEHPLHTLPELRTATAFNLLMPRASAGGRAALGAPIERHDLTYGQVAVQRFISPGLGYEKHHLLAPWIPVTGVAAILADGRNNPLVLRSWGSMHAERGGPVPDWPDLGAIEATDHDGLVLSYPSTWILLPAQRAVPDPTVDRTWQASAGGESCLMLLELTEYRGDAATLDRCCEEARTRAMTRRLDTPGGDLLPRKVPRGVDGETLAIEQRHPSIIGRGFERIHRDHEGSRAAHVSAFGCVWKRHARCDEILAAMDATLPTIVASLRFTPRDPHVAR